MRMCLTSPQFHDLLTTFTAEVSLDKYKKMPYNTYRNLWKIQKGNVVIYDESYTALGKQVERIVVSPDGPVGYEFEHNDGSFGSFLYNFLKEETKVNHEDKPKYDMFGNKIEEWHADKAFDTKVDEAKAAYNEYLVSKYADDNNCAISASQLINDIVDTYSPAISGNYADSATATISTCHTEIKTGLEVVQEKVAEINEDIHDLHGRADYLSQKIENEVNWLDEKVSNAHKRITDETANFESRLYNELTLKADKVEIDTLEKRINAVDDEVYSMPDRIMDEVDYNLGGIYKNLDDLNERLREVEKLVALPKDTAVFVPVDKLITESTSSKCYPKKNYKIDLTGAHVCDCDTDDRKEKENMDTSKMFNFDFGPVASHVRMSPYGLAICGADNKYVSYDKNSGNVVDVEVFNFDAQKFLFKMPVPVSQVAIGDVVVHMRKPMFVREIKGNVVSVVDIYNAEAKDILPVKSPFGFNFITKIVSLVDTSGANDNNPFGNMLPLLMLGDNKDMKDILPFMLMTGNCGAFGNMAQNPLMLYALMGNNENLKDILPFMLMGNMFQAPATAHNCGCPNHEHNGECHN